MNHLTIVTYHYVRPIKGSKFPGIRGLELEGFRRQLDYLDKNYTIIGTEQVIDASRLGSKLPANACWLTFDDGYADHSKFVLPELLKRNLHGAFFPPRVAIEDAVVLEANLVHHILSCVDDVKQLVFRLNSCCRSSGIADSEIDSHYNEYAVPNRFDNAETVYVKRMLQHVLPPELRLSISRDFFDEFVGVSAADFSDELYMSVDEVRDLVKSGMYVGSHGSRHYPLDKISSGEQQKDIQQSLNFLEHVGAPTKDWVMCYPYGAYNDVTLSLVKKHGASLGITIDFGVANFKADNLFALPRLDTNDFPQ